MSVFGYIFLARDRHLEVSEKEQRSVIEEYARSRGQSIEDIIIEEAVSLKNPFTERPAGGSLFRKCSSGDIILVQKAQWVFGSASDADRLLRSLRNAQVAMHCIDLGGNISLPEKRRLVVSDGLASVVEKLIAALIVCESGRHGQAIRTAKNHKKEQGKYLGGPIPFGWEIDKEGYLIPNREQQLVINAIINMRKERWSYREISQKLRDEYEIRLSHEGIRKILKNEAVKAMAGKN